MIDPSTNYDFLTITTGEVLDGEGMTEGVLALHEHLEDSGFPAEDPQTYEIMLATIGLISGAVKNTGCSMVHASEYIARFALRARRDLKSG